MRLTRYDTEAILDFVEEYERDGIDKEVAFQAAAAIARGIWKRDHPDITKLPDHLKPGNVIASLSKAYAERGGGGGAIRGPEDQREG